MTEKSKNKLPPTRARKVLSKKPLAHSATEQFEGNTGDLNGIVEELPPPSPLRGLLPSTPEIEDRLVQALAGRPASPVAHQRMRDDLKMQFYFGGHPVVYRQTSQGKEVLAVGHDEIRRLFRRKRSAAQREAMTLGWWDPW
jgi:hypothetical protein